jgi:hypothetical protein
MKPRQPWTWLILAGVVYMLAGCQQPETRPGSRRDQGSADDLAEASGPAPDANRGLLLKTGAIQLGPGVGKNLWGWQDDGHSGF